MDLSHYAILAELFYFPDEKYPDHVLNAMEMIAENYPQELEYMHQFRALLPFQKETSPVIKLGEIYTRSFDVQSVTTLDMGYLLFGDDYKRGQLLVHLNQEHKDYLVSCRNELADHLPNVLVLLSRLTDQELRAELVWEIIVPSLRLMIAEFDPQRITQKEKMYQKHYKTLIESSVDKFTIYLLILKVLDAVLAVDFAIPKSHGGKTTNRSIDFLNAVGKELEMGKETFKPKQRGAAWTV